MIRKNKIPAYKPETKMCLIFAISTCRLEKYFASIIIRAIFAKSDGWKEKKPKSNQLVEPFTVFPKIGKRSSGSIAHTNTVTVTEVFFKKRKSIKLKPKNTIHETNTQINCLSKKPSFPPNDFIVSKPAKMRGIRLKNKIGSIEDFNFENIVVLSNYCGKNLAIISMR